MKTFRMVPLFLALAVSSVAAQTIGSRTQPVIVDQGPHHNLWQYQTYEPGPDGKPVARIHQYRELASGLNYLIGGKWTPAQEKIEVFSGGSVARHGQHTIIFANNINTPGAIDAQMSDGLRLRSHVLGLIYVDASTGQSVLIGQLQDSEGVLVSDNQVLYPNALAGVRADIRYTYRKSGLEQDIVLREQIPTPESVGLNSATTELEVATEFLEPPSAQVGSVTANDGVESDQTVSWGATSLGLGKAFSLNGEDTPVRVHKKYTKIGGRYFLLEKVRVQDIQPGLSKLPDQASNAKRLPGMASTHFAFPKAPVAKSAARPMRLAMGTPPGKGYVLDYITLGAAYTNFIFQGDTTYYISGSLTLFGTNSFEGGAVLKYSTNATLTIVPSSIPCGINFLTAPYHPVVFTAKDDNTVGNVISGSTGSPSGYYANTALSLAVPSSATPLANFRICYAKQAISYTGGPFYYYSGQIVNCLNGIHLFGSAPQYLRNMLFVNVQTNLNQNFEGQFDIQNSTFCGSSWLMTIQNTGGQTTTLALTNCILVNVTNCQTTGPNPGYYSVGGSFNGFYNSFTLGNNQVISPTYPLQRVGAANGYLANGGVFANAGTAGVDPYLLGLLRAKTVYPPIVLSNLTISVATNYSIQARRDTGTPSLGYHYDPLDYVFSGVNVYSNITFTAGTAAGWFELPNSGGAGYGFSIYDKVVAAFNGTATSPCTFARYSTVQEGGDGLWSNLGYMGGIVSQSLSGGYGMNPANAALISLNFTRCALLSEGPNQFRENNALSQVVARNSEIWNGEVGTYWDYLSATNCLFDRVGMGVAGGNPAMYWLRNCTLRGGSLSLSKYGQTWPVWIEDCAFDGTSIAVDDNSSGNTNITYCDFNAFLTNGSQLPLVPAKHNVTNLLSFNWQSSWFGNFYQTTNSHLINAGSTTADQFGLYHFTTQTNQVPEANSIVDIGYHYVATDAYGNPLDTNGDGNPDYLEDSNGNGIYDAGDLGNWLISTLNGLTPNNGLSVFTPLK